MSASQYIRISCSLLLALFFFQTNGLSQQGISYDIQKPKEFENRTLRSEKSEQKKLTGTGRFIQNTVTHYNYYYNARIKLNDVLERAKSTFKDDFSQLIPFYNYSLDVTAADSTQLDSLSYKSQTAIIVHDLRSDWADNMYLFWGITYYLRKEFDSARLMFQFINYAFAEKEDDGYWKLIGSARDGNSASSISTKEKNSLTNRMFKEPPSRNDAFIWQIRTYLEMDRFSEASSLIQALKRDSLFPKRLRNDLEEMQAYFFYRQNLWDSAGAHLENALGNAANNQERARWEYLIGQLYEESNLYKESERFYNQAINHTTDPVLDIYARLASIRVNKDGGENYIEKNVQTLLKMAKRDKYQDYRDVIYYMAAQMELERNNIDGALALLLKSTKYETIDPTQRNRAFLQLAELSFSKRLYRQSANFYDSLRLDDPTLKNIDEINARKTLLTNLADNIDVIERQDSLQALAAMPEDQREDLVRKLVKQLRKQKGLKDESAMTTGSSSAPTPAPNLFSDGNKKGEWYFYNSNTRQKGMVDFKTKWGTRPNADNWRRSAAISSNIPTRVDNSQTQLQLKNGNDIFSNVEQEATFGALYGRIPLTADKMKVSNDSIQTALFNTGLLYIQELDDCRAGTEALEQIREKFRQHPRMEEVLFNLYYCYNKNGESGKAAQIKQLMSTQYPQSNYTTIVTTGKDPKASGPNSEATRVYEKIYDLFIEGNFTEAVAMKKDADNKYSRNYWTPQLLYIEAIYYIKQRDDNSAKTVLNNIITQFNGTPIGEKAVTMLDVLNRRAQIEEELRNLVIVMPAEDTTNVTTTTVPEPKPTVITPPVVKPDTLKTQPTAVVPVIIAPKTIIDTVVKTAPPVAGFTHNADAPHFVVIILNKVDPVFVSEAKNAFFRYNRDTYYNKPMQAELVEIDADNRLLLISPFKNAAEAIAYIDQTKPKTSTEIVPWLKGGKYTYSIITEKNLDLLKNNKDIDKYTQFLQNSIPGKF